MGQLGCVEIIERVRFAETDLMGVAHHANYFRWFEMGRVEYLRRCDLLLNDLVAEGILFPITSVDCEYKHPARFDDGIVIRASLDEFSRVKLVFSYQILRKIDNRLLATGHTINTFTDTAGKIVRLPDKFYQRLK